MYGTYGAVKFGSIATPGSDWNYSQVGSRTTFTPVANLDLSVDVMYQKLGTASAGAFGTVPGRQHRRRSVGVAGDLPRAA